MLFPSFFRVVRRWQVSQSETVCPRCGTLVVTGSRVMSQSEDVVAKPDTKVFLQRAANFRSLFKTSVPSKQSRATASRFRSSTLLLFLLLERDVLKFVDFDAAHQCQKQVIAGTFLTLFSFHDNGVRERRPPPSPPSTLPRSAAGLFRRYQLGCHQGRSLENSLSSSRDDHMRSFCCFSGLAR